MSRLDIDIRWVREADPEPRSLLHLQCPFPDAVTSIEAVEQHLHRLGVELLRRLFQAFLEAQDGLWAASRKHREENCRVTNEGHRSLLLKTIMGPIKIRRQKQYCQTHDQWFVPFNHALGLDLENAYLTQGLVELATRGALNMPFIPAAVWVDYFTGSQDLLDPSEIQHLVVAHGQAVRAREKAREEQLRSAEVVRIQDRMWYSDPAPVPVRSNVLYIGVDGIMIREQPGADQWLTGYAGVLFTAKERVGKARFRLTEKRYVTSFAGIEEFGQRVQGAARLLHWEDYAEIRWLVDGAQEFLRLAETHSPRDGRAVTRLDWYHLARKVKQHLGTAFPQPEARRKAIQEINTLLWHGQSEEAWERTQALRPGAKAGLAGWEALEKLGAYLQHNRPYMGNYWAEQNAGYMISSALAEKACDVLIAKRQKKKQGMRWSATGADALAALRTLFLNEEWEDYWQLQSAVL